MEGSDYVILDRPAPNVAVRNTETSISNNTKYRTKVKKYKIVSPD